MLQGDYKMKCCHCSHAINGVTIGIAYRIAADLSGAAVAGKGWLGLAHHLQLLQRPTLCHRASYAF